MRRIVGSVSFWWGLLFLFALSCLLGGTTSIAVPPGFTGQSIDELGAALEKRLPPKDEYETSADFLKRVSQFQFHDLLAVRGDPAEMTYDADQGLLTIRLKNVQSVKFKPGLLNQATPDGGVSPCLDVGEKYLIQDAGQESPAFYLEVVNAEELVENKNVIRSYQGGKDPQWQIGLNLNLTPAAARQLKEKLGVLLICRGVRRTVSAPPVVYRRHLDREYRCIGVRLLEAWVYDRQSGRVVHAESIAGPRDRPPGEEYLPALRKILNRLQ